MYIAQECPTCKKISLCVREYDTWIGYYCKSCGYGGSKKKVDKDKKILAFKFGVNANKIKYKRGWIV